MPIAGHFQHVNPFHVRKKPLSSNKCLIKRQRQCQDFIQPKVFLYMQRLSDNDFELTLRRYNIDQTCKMNSPSKSKSEIIT
jgi:hypothetical protein